MRGFIFGILAFTIFVHPAFGSGRDGVIERVQYHMGTYARVLIYGGTNADADAAFLKIKELDELLSDYDPASEVSEITRMAGKVPIKASRDTIDVLKEAVYVSGETDGAFDPTIGALTIGVYRFGRDGGRVPGDEEIAKAKSLVNYRDLLIDGDEVYLEREGMMLDLGGIGKGYAVEEAVLTLKRRGIKKGMVSLSGDIKVFGDDVEMGIRDPNGKGTIASFHTGAGELAISTSGGYERVIDPGGKAYHHLLVPSTGKPGRDFLSVTVFLDGDSALADAYATVLFVMGKEKALSFLKKHPEVGVFMVLPGGEIYCNDRMKSLVRGLKTGDG
ncbi:MAG TPA: FAD:protein FMN transferase [Thermodesulfobacteriota bacterium]|nr:FAD:protein FMN transferase [Thermodesulfobacteriota bacterium]